MKKIIPVLCITAFILSGLPTDSFKVFAVTPHLENGQFLCNASSSDLNSSQPAFHENEGEREEETENRGHGSIKTAVLNFIKTDIEALLQVRRQVKLPAANCQIEHCSRTIGLRAPPHFL